MNSRPMRFARATLSAMGLMAAATVLPSVAWRQGNAKGRHGDAPRLTEIVPARGPAGAAYPLQATLRGTGFAPIGNTVEFGPARLADLPSANGKEIAFAIPKTLPSRGEVPPMVLPPGEYRVSVTTPAGTSNPLTFTLTPGP